MRFNVLCPALIGLLGTCMPSFADPTDADALLAVALEARHAFPRGDARKFCFWDGLEEGSTVEVKSSMTFSGKESDESGTFFLKKRSESVLTVEEDRSAFTADAKFDREFLTPGVVDEKREVRELPDAETLTIGGKEFRCRVVEWTETGTPMCGMGSPQKWIRRLKVWVCGEAPVRSGILKLVQTTDGDWGNGKIEFEGTEEMRVVALDVKRKVGAFEIPCYEVELEGRAGDVAMLEGREFRCDHMPGGAVESTEKRREGKGSEVWSLRESRLLKVEAIRSTGDRPK